MNRKTILATLLLASLFLPLVAAAGTEPSAYIDLGGGPTKLVSACKPGDPASPLPIKLIVNYKTQLSTGVTLAVGSVVLDGDEVTVGAFVNDGDEPIEVLYSNASGQQTVVLQPNEALKVGAVLLDVTVWCPYVRCHCCNDVICLANPVYIPSPVGSPAPWLINGSLCEIPGYADGQLQDCVRVFRPCIVKKNLVEAVYQKLQQSLVP